MNMDFMGDKTSLTVVASLAGLTVALFFIGFLVKFYADTPWLLNDSSMILSLALVFLVITIVFVFYRACCMRRCKVEK